MDYWVLSFNALFVLWCAMVLVIYITFQKFQSPTGNMYGEYHQAVEIIESSILFVPMTPIPVLC